MSLLFFLCSCVGFVGSSWEILSGEVVKVGSYAVVCVRGVTVELGFGEKIRLLRFECSSIVSNVVSVRFFFSPASFLCVRWVSFAGIGHFVLVGWQWKVGFGSR